MRSMKLAAVAVAAQAAIFAASPASAGPVIYQYTGNNFTSVFAPGYTTSDKITGTITLSRALPDSLTTLTDETARSRAIPSAMASTLSSVRAATAETRPSLSSRRTRAEISRIGL